MLTFSNKRKSGGDFENLDSFVLYIQSMYCFENAEIMPQVLVGPTDWKEHASGKIPDRFRVNNLPSQYDGPGIYELGVTPPAWLPPQRNSDSDFLKPQDVVVVYLGCADNINYHLQRYGQTGAHLEGARLVDSLLFKIQNALAQLALPIFPIVFILVGSRAGQQDCLQRRMKPQTKEI